MLYVPAQGFYSTVGELDKRSMDSGFRRNDR